MLNETVELLKAVEGYSERAYQDSGGVWTIGYGRTGGVQPTETTTKEAETRFLEEQVMQIELQLSKLIDFDVWFHLTDNNVSALVSLVYNIGIGAFKNSTLLKRLNAKQITLACQEFGKWIYVNKRINKGLVNRRMIESYVFCGIDAETSKRWVYE